MLTEIKYKQLSTIYIFIAYIISFSEFHLRSLRKVLSYPQIYTRRLPLQLK